MTARIRPPESEEHLEIHDIAALAAKSAAEVVAFVQWTFAAQGLAEIARDLDPAAPAILHVAGSCVEMAS